MTVSSEESFLCIPYSRNIIARQRLNDQHKEQGRKPQPVGPVANEMKSPFLVECPGYEIPRQKEKETHKKRLQKNLVGYESELLREAQFRRLLDVPASVTAIGNRCVHTQHQHDHDPADIVDKDQSRGCRAGRGRLHAGSRWCNGGGVGEDSIHTPKLPIVAAEAIFFDVW